MFSNYQHRDYIRDIAAERMQRQITQDRSRSRSRSRSRRSVARSRSVPATRLVRTLRYKGDCQLCRSVVMPVTISTAQGFTINGAGYSEAVFTYSPQYLRLRGDATHSLTALIPQAAELAAVWERVRIDRVELTITSNLSDEQVTQGSGLPAAQGAARIILANDWSGPDNGGSTGTLSQVLQETNAKMFHIGGDHEPATWSITKPKYNRLIQYTDVESDFEPSNGFVNSRTDIQHHGTRIGIADMGAVWGSRMLVFAKFYFTFKNVH